MRLEISLDRAPLARLHIDVRKKPASTLRVRGEHARRPDEHPRRRTEHPLRPAELRLRRRILQNRLNRTPRIRSHPSHRPDTTSTTRPDRWRSTATVRTPTGLINRFVLTAGDDPRIRHRTRCRHVRDPQLRSIPRHVRVAPRDPAQARTVGTESRRGIEVVAGGNHLAGGAAIERHAHERRHRLAVAGMVLADADQPVPQRIDRVVRIEPLPFRRDRERPRRSGFSRTHRRVTDCRRADR